MSEPLATPSDAGRYRLLALVAAAWFIGFTLYFFSRGLPNNSPWTRPDLWRESPWLILDSLLPPVPGPEQTGPASSGWRFLPQRFPLILCAVSVLVGSWCLGSLLLRALGMSSFFGDERTRSSRQTLHIALAGLLGLSAWALVMLALGLAGVMNQWLTAGLLLLAIAAEIAFDRRNRRDLPPLVSPRFWSATLAEGPLPKVVLAASVPFLMAMVLGSLLPSTDFDVKAYHLVGPKEWFQAGRITFLPHNIYTSFPFLTEMLLLSSMVLSGDWFSGGIAGQLVLASFGVYTAIVVFHLAARFGRTAGWLAAFIYLTTPWVCRISIIAYVEGALAAYLAATLACFLLSRTGEDSLRWTALCGFFAGSAASCKYPGVISALIPFGLLVLIDAYRLPAASRVRSVLLRTATFSAAGLVAFGPWLLKNLVQAGNPVYPLLWGLFGGRAFDAELNARFKAGHALPVDVLKNPLAWIPDLWRHVVDVAVGSDWQSPLMFGLAPVAILVWWRRSRSRASDPSERSATHDLGIMLLFAAWLFLTWWGLTHRIDRFWVPMLPVLAVLAGIVLQVILDGAGPVAKALVGFAVALTTWYHLAFIASPFIGFNGYLMNESVARRIAQAPGMAIVNSLPDDAHVLLIGEAQVFEARRPVIYSTVFNENVFEELFAAPSNEGAPKTMRSRDELKAILKVLGITHLLVNWNEVLRYRTTYGYSDFVTPENVRHLARLGLVVEESLPATIPAVSKVADKGESTQFQLSTWGKSLIRRESDGDWYPAYELWRVVE